VSGAGSALRGQPEEARRSWAPGTAARGVDWRLLPVALSVLAVCLFYTIGRIYGQTYAGFSYDRTATVIALAACDERSPQCQPGSSHLQVGDRILRIGETTSDEFVIEDTRSPLAGYRAGDVVPILVDRDGEPLEVLWELQPRSLGALIRGLALPPVVYMPFWVAGTLALLLRRFRGQQGRLFIALCYATALWLAFGLGSNPSWYGDSQLMRAFSWLFVPLYLHFHLKLPVPLGDHSQRRLVLAPAYVLGLLLALADTLDLIPNQAFVVALFLAIVGGLAALAIRILSEPGPAVRVPTQLMLGGWLLAFSPALLLWLIPGLLGRPESSATAINLSLLGLPFLPLVYLYALYKYRLGRWETRVHRALFLYGLCWFYMATVTLAVQLLSSWLSDPSQVFVVGLGAALAALVVGLLLQQRLISFSNRMAYGVRYRPEELFRHFASLIPAAVDRERLARLLMTEVTPALGVTQSTLYLAEGDRATVLYAQGCQGVEQSLPIEELTHLLQEAGAFRPEASPGANAAFDWVRLVIPVRLRDSLTGLWLLGARSADDFYSRSDVSLLTTLGNQIAVTVQNVKLLRQARQDLKEREAAQQTIQQYAGRLQLMHDIERAILQAVTTEDIARVVADRLLGILPASGVRISTLQPQGSGDRILAFRTQGDLQVDGDLVIPLADLVSAGYAQGARLELVPDVRLIGLDKAAVARAYGAGLRSLVLAPLAVGETHIGLLTIGLRAHQSLSDEHLAIVEEVGRSVAVALHNAYLLERVTQYSSELQHLSAELIDAQEQERKRIAQELHDEMGQTLAAIAIDLKTVEEQVDGSCGPQVMDRLADARALVHTAIEQVRALSLDLRPSMLADFGLETALRWLVDQQQKRTAVAIGCHLEGIERRLPERIETAAYRIVQEGITNVVRHAGARQIHLHLRRDPESLLIQIVDDGIGFRPAPSAEVLPEHPGAGLLGMRERVRTLGGRFDLQTGPGQGTRIDIEIPLPELP
jgi:signal transduction histidine kinase